MCTTTYADNNLPLPPEKMPKCWNEEERMSALFSPFRSKSTNPRDWIDKYNFWHSLIKERLIYTAQCSFTFADLCSAFKRQGCTPLCLVTVIEELLRNNEIILETEFLKEPCDSWIVWPVDIFVKRPLVWLFSKATSYVMNNESNTQTRYIHLQVVKELGETLFSILEDKQQNILIPFPEIVKDCKCKIDKCITDNTVMIVLIWLRRKKRIAFTNINENELLIKITVHESDNVTEIDEGLYKLMKQENELIKEIQVMEEEKINIVNQTKSYLGKGLRQVAKAHLRKKKELENTIDKRSQTLENIRALISNIQDTCTNTAVLSAYKAGSGVLKKLNESGLSEDNIRAAMDDLSEALEEQKEVQFMLSETFKDDELNTDLEQELEELMKLEESMFPPIPNTKLDSINELEQSLKDLHMDGSTSSKASSRSLSSQTTQHKKNLAELQCT